MDHRDALEERLRRVADEAIRTQMLRIFEKTIRTLIKDAAAGVRLPAREDASFDSKFVPRTSTLMVSELLDEYERISAASLDKKSPNQLRKWRVARQVNLDTFIEAIGGGRPLEALEHTPTHRFFDYWQKRVLGGEVRINSANRLMRHISGMYSAIHAFYQIDKKNPFFGLRIRGGREGKRLAYAPLFVQNSLLADGVFDRLNPEARRIIYLISETGIRPSEACALDATTIHLNSKIPFIQVTDDSRETKTPGSVRNIPLVGVALLAMRQQPNGFPRYSNKADVASATINKALKEKKPPSRGRDANTLFASAHAG